jgi:hypothetical protein
VIDCCLTPDEHFFSYVIAKTSYIQWNVDDDDEVRFVLDQLEMSLHSDFFHLYSLLHLDNPVQSW